MFYHHIVLNTILPALTYAYPTVVPLGTLVSVKLRGKTQMGIVWANDVTPDIALEKILPIDEVFPQIVLPEKWRALITFSSRYYHYPIGQTAFAALPSLLKIPKNIALPQSPVLYTFNDLGRAQKLPPERHIKKYAFWQMLLSGSHDLAALKQKHHQAEALLREYEQLGWLDIQTVDCPVIAPSLYILNEAQNIAAQAIKQKLGQYQTFLLYGITGSGKTEVYFDVIADVLQKGKQVLFLLPEINLTPQMMLRVAQRFPNVSTAVLHSQTAAGQRKEDYLRAMLGQAKLVLGTRLAVFTPLQNVGLIVVDEEHDSSFKQENDLRYNARDLAIWRARQEACPIVLGSATPSLETWHKAQQGSYQLLMLPERAVQMAKLPDIRLIDVRHEKLDNGFSSQALEQLKRNYQQGGLSLVYVNRRGFAPALFCSDCGHIFSCPHCSAKMVWHAHTRELRCHHCDFRQPVPMACSECGNQDLTPVGQGSQRVEETLKKFLPNAKVLRVDRDTTNKKDDWTILYDQIAANEVDILVGTQMLSKGHDFGRLNLVVVLNADGSLFSSDFRAPERLFSELMQVSGRAGRAERAGRVLIQTQLPEHPIFHAILAQDFSKFAQQELAQREMFNLPPFGFQAAIRADAAQLRDAENMLNTIRDTVAPLLPENVWQLGALPMQMMRLASRERAQIFLESTDRMALHRALGLWQQMLVQNKDNRIRWHIDVDYQEM